MVILQTNVSSVILLVTAATAAGPSVHNRLDSERFAGVHCEGCTRMFHYRAPPHYPVVIIISVSEQCKCKTSCRGSSSQLATSQVCLRVHGLVKKFCMVCLCFAPLFLTGKYFPFATLPQYYCFLFASLPRI